MTTKTTIDWDSVITEVKDALDFFNQRSIKPTLRTMFYRLVALEKLPNTKNSYKGLSHNTVKARKSGLLPMNCFADEGRIIKGNVPTFQEPQDYIDSYLDFIRDIPTNYFKYKVPRWHNQSKYLELWIEKLALADTVEQFTGNRQVRIAVNRGYSGLSFFYEGIKRLKQNTDDNDKEIVIKYLGDFDPSGADMDRYIQQTLEEFDMSNVRFERIAITKEQIEKYHLPEVPEDAETLEKVARDTRTKGFIAEHGRLYVVELDALLAVVPDDFEKLIQDSIDVEFDDKKYQELKKTYNQNEIREMLIETTETTLEQIREDQSG